MNVHEVQKAMLRVDVAKARADATPACAPPRPSLGAASVLLSIPLVVPSRSSSRRARRSQASTPDRSRDRGRRPPPQAKAWKKDCEDMIRAAIQSTQFPSGSYGSEGLNALVKACRCRGGAGESGIGR